IGLTSQLQMECLEAKPQQLSEAKQAEAPADLIHTLITPTLQLRIYVLNVGWNRLRSVPACGKSLNCQGCESAVIPCAEKRVWALLRTCPCQQKSASRDSEVSTRAHRFGRALAVHP